MLYCRTFVKRDTVVPPVTSVRGLLEVKTQAHSSVQLTAPYLPLSFQSLLSTNCRSLLCQRLYRPMSLVSRFNISSRSFLPLHVRKLLFMDGSIVSRARGVRYLGAHFCLSPLSCMKQVPFESTGIGLQFVCRN